MKKWLKQRRSAIWQLVSGVSLRVKIMGIALAMIILLGLSLTWQVRAAMARSLTWEMEQRGISIARGLASRSFELILTNDFQALHELAQDTVWNNADVQYALVTTSQGTALSHSFEGDFPTELLEANSVRSDQHYHLETLQTEEGLVEDVAIPILEGHTGVARVGMSHHRLDHAIADVTRRILLTTLLISLLGIAISITLTWVFTRPLLTLARATRQVVEEDLNHRITPWANDEVGQLQASFNTMVEHLAHSRQETEDYNHRLLRRNQELAALYAISSAVVGSQGLTEVLERALYQAMDMAQATTGWVCILGKNDSCQVCVYAPSNIQSNIRSACCQECSTCREAARTRRPLIVDSFPSECLLGATLYNNEHPITGHVIVPLLVKKQTVGILNLAWGGPDDISPLAEKLDPLAAVGQQLGVAIENARLWEELVQKEILRGQLLRKVITAQEDERKRIARDLHDRTGQALTSLLIGLRAMEKSNSLDQVQALTTDLKLVVALALDEVHSLALELRPSVLDDLGLVPALTRYAQSCPVRLGFQVDFVTSGMNDQRLPPEVETTLYRITQEALTNVARHADANQVSVLLQRRRGTIILVIEDDGEGFDVAQVMASLEKQDRLGLYGVEERASLVGGKMIVESSPNTGTTITVEIPLEGAWTETQRTEEPMNLGPSAS
ncbi:MAG: GAF domain-containing protein [Chloroflexi bacterium]|nr:GAF domain-containing protein [Chloroflexota bacterium]